MSRNRRVAIMQEVAALQRGRSIANRLLLKAIERVRTLHAPVEQDGRTVCGHCTSHTSGAAPVAHPCPTITALDDPTESTDQQQ